MRRKNKKDSKNRLIIALSFIILAVLSVFILEKTNVIDFINKDTSSNSPKVNDVNYDPPTDEELAAGDQQKDKIVNPNTPGYSKDSGSGKKSVSVLITDASQYENGVIEVRAFVPNYLGDGTCTISITKDSETITKEAPAYADASTTICTNPAISRSEFSSPGDWQVVVSFTSSDATGTSSPKTLVIK